MPLLVGKGHIGIAFAIPLLVGKGHIGIAFATPLLVGKGHIGMVAAARARVPRVSAENLTIRANIGKPPKELNELRSKEYPKSGRNATTKVTFF
jgi:hypothetical protein